jgi:hypothetical protein
MIKLNRRGFIQASAASMLLNRVVISPSPVKAADINDTPQGVAVKGKNYTFR